MHDTILANLSADLHLERSRTLKRLSGAMQSYTGLRLFNSNTDSKYRDIAKKKAKTNFVYHWVKVLGNLIANQKLHDDHFNHQKYLK
jgi:hypothetical protein